MIQAKKRLPRITLTMYIKLVNVAILCPNRPDRQHVRCVTVFSILHALSISKSVQIMECVKLK